MSQSLAELCASAFAAGLAPEPSLVTLDVAEFCAARCGNGLGALFLFGGGMVSLGGAGMAGLGEERW